MIVGGASLYALALPLADQLYMTLVDADVEGDTRFPDFDLSEWREISRRRHAPDNANSYAMEFLQLTRKR